MPKRPQTRPERLKTGREGHKQAKRVGKASQADLSKHPIFAVQLPKQNVQTCSEHV